MGELVEFQSNGGQAQGYLARPEGAPRGGVVVIQEWWGLVPHILGVAERFAAEGYLALAPDLFHGAHTVEPDAAMRLLMGLAMDQAARDIAGAADHLVSLGVTRVGAVGFCMGGSLALWSGTLSDSVVATVGFYPGLPWERMAPVWQRYAGKEAVIHCSAADGTSSADGIQQAKAGIETAGGAVALYDYPGTEHAFFNDQRPEVYAAAPAALAWERTLEFFARTLA